MTFAKDEDIGYLYLKGLLSMIYSDNFNHSAYIFQSLLNINEDYLLIMLKNYVNIWNNCIDNEMKNNIYSLIQLLRNNLVNIEDHNRVVERSQIMNEILWLTNGAHDQNISVFLLDELRKRYNSLFMAVKILGLIPIHELKQYLNFCIQDDFYILYTHSSIVSDEKFEIDQFVHRNIDYILNINNLLNEWPSLFKDKTFMGRVSQVVRMLKTEVNDEKIALFGKAVVHPQKMLRRLEKNLDKYKKTTM